MTDEVARLRQVPKLARALAEGEVPLRDLVTRALEKQPGTDRILLLADQWEELYPLCPDEPVRCRFTDQLLDATSGGSLTVVLTLRGDFYGHALSYRPLADRLQDAVVNLGPMTGEELERAVVGPAEKLHLNFEAGLAKRILNDVRKEPGNPPVLELVLTELWQKRHGGATEVICSTKRTRPWEGSRAPSRAGRRNCSHGWRFPSRKWCEASSCKW
jgi:hypothetical protein